MSDKIRFPEPEEFIYYYVQKKKQIYKGYNKNKVDEVLNKIRTYLEEKATYCLECNRHAIDVNEVLEMLQTE